MINISKECFNRVITEETTCQVWHSFAGSCLNFTSSFGIQCLYGASKFFLPIYLVKILLNRKRADIKFLKEQLRAYLRSIMYMAAYGTSAVGLLCVVAKIYSIFYYMVVFTGFLSCYAIIFEVPENREINTLLMFNQCLEAFLNHAVSNKLIERTPKGETTVFMLVSAALMYLFKTQKTKKILNLWFYPVSNLKRRGTETESSSQNKCAHKDSCLRYCYKEGIKYFGIGYALEIVRTVIPRFLQAFASPRMMFKVLFNKKNVLFGLFFGGYVAIYRYVLCLLTRTDRGEMASHSLIAGFLAGCTYRFKPNTQILIIGVATILQLLVQRIKEAYNLPEDFPYYLIVFFLSCAVLQHFRFLLPISCPAYARNMYDMCSNNWTKKIDENFFNHIKNTELKLAGAS